MRDGLSDHDFPEAAQSVMVGWSGSQVNALDKPGKSIADISPRSPRILCVLSG
jgi:hypothetical protein